MTKKFEEEISKLFPFKEYINKCYKTDVTKYNVYFTEDKIVVLISAHNLNLKSFWSGEWLSTWEYDIKSKKLKGNIKDILEIFIG